MTCQPVYATTEGERQPQEGGGADGNPQTDTGRTQDVKKAAKAATSKKSIAKMPKKVKTSLGKQGAAVAQRKKTGTSSPKTRQELYEEAKRRNIRGRSKMGRDELAKALGGRS